MIVAVLGESPADEAAVRMLVDAILGEKTVAPKPFPRLDLRRGWTNILKLLPKALMYFYYQTDAVGLVVVLDSNGSPVTAERGAGTRPSRLFEMHRILEETGRTLTPRPGRVALKTAAGLAAPAVEAWYRCGPEAHTTETAWIRHLEAGKRAPLRIRELRKAVYGTDQPSLKIQTEHAETQARRLSQIIDQLEKDFPVGFGALARDVRNWREET